MTGAGTSALRQPPGSCLCTDTGEPAWARSLGMRRILAAIERLAPARTAVLLAGEPGTGKDWLARLLHRRGGRSGPVLSVPCEGLSGEHLGRFLLPEAAGATLLLQEVGRLTADGQRRLAELLDEMEPSLACRPPEVELPDYRIVASSTEDLARSVASGAFLPGLYYRLAAAELRIPPLRERREDIEGLVAILLSELEQKYDRGPFVVTDALLEALRSAPWPGNVRQLRSVLERAIVLWPHEQLDLDILPANLACTRALEPLEVRIGTSLAEAERELILQTLRACDGRRLRAARVLGISRRTLHYRLRQYRVEGLPI